MANRWFNQFFWTIEKTPVKLWARVSFGAAGAPTLDAVNSKGIKSITRTSAGLYVITFGGSSVGQPLDIYNRLLQVTRTFVLGSGHPASPNMFVVSEAVATAATVTVQFDNAAGTTATDPANGEVVLLEFSLKNSTAP